MAKLGDEFNIYEDNISLPTRLWVLNSTQFSSPCSPLAPPVCLFLQPAVQESISLFMAYVHTSVNQASEKYQRNEKRYNYTTPKSFLQQITLYRNLLEKSRAQLQHKMNRLDSGLQKLQTTAAQVNVFIINCRESNGGFQVEGNIVTFGIVLLLDILFPQWGFCLDIKDITQALFCVFRSMILKLNWHPKKRS